MDKLLSYSLVSWFCFLVFISPQNTGLAADRYELPSGKFICELSLEIAKAEAGITDAKNPQRVREYLKAAGVGYYNPFCASGQYWSFKQAQKTIEGFNKLFRTSFISAIPYPRSALANAPYNYAKKNGTKTAYKAQKYDFLIWIYGNGPNGHIERIDSILSSGWVRCIGFNTGNREVKFTKRNIYSPIGRRRVRGLVGFNCLYK